LRIGIPTDDEKYIANVYAYNIEKSIEIGTEIISFYETFKKANK